MRYLLCTYAKLAFMQVCCLSRSHEILTCNALSASSAHVCCLQARMITACCSGIFPTCSSNMALHFGPHSLVPGCPWVPLGIHGLCRLFTQGHIMPICMAKSASSQSVGMVYSEIRTRMPAARIGCKLRQILRRARTPKRATTSGTCQRQVVAALGTCQSLPVAEGKCGDRQTDAGFGLKSSANQATHMGSNCRMSHDIRASKIGGGYRLVVLKAVQKRLKSGKQRSQIFGSASGYNGLP